MSEEIEYQLWVYGEEGRGGELQRCGAGEELVAGRGVGCWIGVGGGVKCMRQLV